ncbi:hypothetical protein C8Q74DRAFT_1212793 [Fomes fomentarius]|nr:hypothetical protein C8Q74DRAFT_1212793 [Fomes fomentarius]
MGSYDVTLKAIHKSKAVTREKVKRISQGRRNAMKPQELPLPKVEDALEDTTATITMSSTALSVESTSGRRRGAASEAYTGRLSHDAYKVLRAFFRDVTSNPTLAQCNELSYKIQQLSGCEACTCEKIRQYFANRKRNLARRTSTVLGVDTIPLGVEEDSKEGILTPKEVFQVSAHAPAASGIAHENSTAQKTEALVQATNSLSADVQRGPSGTHVPQYPSQACTAVTHAAEFHVWYIGYPSSPAPSTDLYAQSDLRKREAAADDLSLVCHATCLVPAPKVGLLYGSWRPDRDEDFDPQWYMHSMIGL